MNDSAAELLAAQKILSDGFTGAVRFELAKANSEGAYAYGLRLLAPWMRERIRQEVELVSIQNHLNERQATRSHCPECRIPEFMYICYELIFGEGCWHDKAFRDDTLKHHPGLRCKVKYGTKGQEYVTKQ